MKRTVFKITAFILCIVMLFSGCGFNSGIAILSIESSDRTSWSQSHHLLRGTKSHTMNLGKKEIQMEAEVVTEEGEIDIFVTTISGEILLEIEDAKTGIYDFSASGRIKIKIVADDHRGSINVNPIDS